MNKYLLLTIVAAVGIALTGCRHKDFCYDHPHGEIFIEIEYDDDNDPDDIVHIRDIIRATRLLAYHEPTGERVLESDIDRRANALPLDAGTYHFTAYNAGTQSISFSDYATFRGHAAGTRECDILEPLFGTRAVRSDVNLGNGEPVVIPAEPLWSAGAEAAACNIGDTIRMKAVPLHCRYTFEMRNIEGLEAVSRISSFITGMAGGAELSSAELHDTPVTVAVPASVGADNKSIVGSFICFGHNPRIGARHRMGLFVEMESGEKYMLIEGEHFDVTAQVAGAANRRRVHIIIDGVTLPAPQAGAGFEVTLSPWGTGEDVDINYGF